MEICQMDALVPEDDHTEVLRSHCIGCGVCLNVCPTGAIILVRKEKVTIPPDNKMTMYRRMILERYGPLGTLKLLGKAFMGKKI
jgi:Fe-S-cluster-containing hydrogenase component 2